VPVQAVIDATWAQLRAPGVFSKTNRRLIEGIASTGEMNEHGFTLAPEGAQWKLHCRYCGGMNGSAPLLVIDARLLRSKKIWFKAQLANAVLPQIDEVWEAVKSCVARGTSASHSWLDEPTWTGEARYNGYTHHAAWTWDELSLCNGPHGANHSASIHICKEISLPGGGVVCLDPENSRYTTVHWDDRPEVVRLRPY